MNRIKRLLVGFIAAAIIFTTVPISASNPYKTTEPQISNVTNALYIDQLTVKSKKTVTVYITKTGKKYHRSGCRYLRQSKIAISLSNAKSSGYTPCKVCNPPR